MARFLRDSPYPKIHVSYEDIAKIPKALLPKYRIFRNPFEPDAVNFLKKLHRG